MIYAQGKSSILGFLQYKGLLLGQRDGRCDKVGRDWQLAPATIDSEVPWWQGLIHIGAFFAKVIGFILFFIVVRWTLPRFRYDQLMRLGWVFFFEIALANVVLTAILLWVLK